MSISHAFRPGRALVRAVEIVRLAPILLILAGTLLLFLSVIDYVLGLVFADLKELGQEIVGHPVSVLLTLLFGGCCLQFVVQPARAWLLGGFARSVRDVVQERRASWGTVFGPHAWFSVFVTSLVSSVMLSVVSMYLLATSVLASILDTLFLMDSDTTLSLALLLSLVLVPILTWIWIGLLPAPYVAALTGASPWRALRVSWRWSKGRRIRLLWFRVVTWFAGMGGTLLCGVGVAATWTLAEIAWIEAALQALQDDERNAATVAATASDIETTSE